MTRDSRLRPIHDPLLSIVFSQTATGHWPGISSYCFVRPRMSPVSCFFPLTESQVAITSPVTLRMQMDPRNFSRTGRTDWAARHFAASLQLWLQGILLCLSHAVKIPTTMFPSTDIVLVFILGVFCTYPVFLVMLRCQRNIPSCSAIKPSNAQKFLVLPKHSHLISAWILG